MTGNLDTPPSSIVHDPQDDDEEEVLENVEEMIEVDETELEQLQEEELAVDMEEGGLSVSPRPDDASVVFQKHTGSVFCCHLNPKNGDLAVTGGEDDKAYVWNIKTGEVELECTGHKDSVTAVAFSHDGSLVATADMSGLIRMWKLSSKEVVWEFEADEVTWMNWHRGSRVLFAGTEGGDMFMWKMPSGECKSFPGPGARCDCGKLLPDGRRYAVGYGDGSVKIFDLKTTKVLYHLTGTQGHESCLTSLACHADNNLIMTGSTDGSAKMITSQNGKVLATFACSRGSIEAVGFCPDKSLSLAATGTLEGELIIWDISTQTQRHSCRQDGGISQLVWAVNAPLVYTAGLDGVVRVYSAHSGKLENQYSGHLADVFDIDLSHDGSVLVTASDDTTCRVFTLTQPGQ